MNTKNLAIIAGLAAAGTVAYLVYFRQVNLLDNSSGDNSNSGTDNQQAIDDGSDDTERYEGGGSSSQDEWTSNNNTQDGGGTASDQNYQNNEGGTSDVNDNTQEHSALRNNQENWPYDPDYYDNAYTEQVR